MQLQRLEELGQPRCTLVIMEYQDGVNDEETQQQESLQTEDDDDPSDEFPEADEKVERAEEREFLAVHKYLVSREYPQHFSKDQKRVLRRKAKRYIAYSIVYLCHKKVVPHQNWSPRTIYFNKTGPPRTVCV